MRIRGVAERATSNCPACRPNPLKQTLHTEIPEVTQYASPGLIESIAYAGHDSADDPAWRISGAANQAESGRWCGQLCGMACLKMVLHHRDGHAPPLFELAAEATRYGAYVELPDGRIKGMTYAPFITYVQEEHGLAGEMFTGLESAAMLTFVNAGQLVLASVHKEIRRPHLPAPGKGGHLVLVTGGGNGLIRFQNPSGHTPQARTTELSLEVFETFFAGRGVAIRL